MPVPILKHADVNKAIELRKAGLGLLGEYCLETEKQLLCNRGYRVAWRSKRFYRRVSPDYEGL